MKRNFVVIILLILLIAGLAAIVGIEYNIIPTDSIINIITCSATVAVLAIIISTIAFIANRKNRIHKVKYSESIPNIEDFNQLEEDFLSSMSMVELYEKASNWLFTKFPLTYVAFSLITPNDKLSIEFFKTNKILEKEYYNAMSPYEYNLISSVAERTQNGFDKDSVVHENDTYSMAFSRKGSILGYIFVGYTKVGNNISKGNLNYVRPFIRIFNTACLVLELAKTKEQRISLQKAFSSYVPSALVNSFEHDPSVLKIGGEHETLSIMFTDLQGFTAFSQTMQPDVLITLLNEYFSEMSGVIERFGGTVSKLAGDGILAFFRAPDTDGHHAERCCEAALIMKKYEQILNAKLIESGRIKEPLFTRIGINTGEVILGNIGSEKRLDYTIMGPEVNLTSRIEQANKKLKTQILISNATYLEVNEAFNCQAVAYAKLKGFTEAVQLYELIEKVDITEPIITFTENLDEIEDAEAIEELEEI